MFRPIRSAIAARPVLASLAVLTALVLTGAPGAALGQDRGAAPPPPPAGGNDDVPPPARVYVPFEDLKKVFGQEGQGVFVPYAEFRELWRKAMEKGAPEGAVSGVSSASYEGRIDGELALIEAKIEIQSGTDGESAVPIGLANATLGSAALDGKPAILLSDKKGRRVVVRGKGPHTLDVTLVAPVLPKDGDRIVAFPSAGAAVSKLAFTVPGEGVKVTVEPNLATTRTDASADGKPVTQVLAYVGAAPEIKLTWRPKPVTAAGAEAIVQAQSEVLHRVGEQTIETRVFARFTALRGGIGSVRARFPATERVLQVEGAGIRSWEESEQDGTREVRVALHNDADVTYDLRLLLERPRAPGETAADLPNVTFPGTSRDAGTVAVQVLPPIAVRPATIEGLYRVPTDDLSAWMKSGLPAPAPGVTVLAWRHTGGARRASLSIETVAPEVTVEERTTLTLVPGNATLLATFLVNVERAGLFQVSLAMPEGWDLDAARLSAPGENAPIDARVEGEAAARRLILDLRTRRMGGFGIHVSLRRTLPRADTEESLALPVLALDGAARSRGVVLVAAEESLDVRTGASTGFVPAEPAALGLAERTSAAASALFGFRHAGEPRSATLLLVRRKPLVTAETVTTCGVETDRLQMRHVLIFNVRYAGVDTFRFSLPKSVAERVRIEGASIKERSKAADPEDAERVIHTVVLQAPAIGNVQIVAEYELPQEPLAVGGSRKSDVPALRVHGAERDQGWVQVSRDPTLSVDGEAKAMLYSDVREIPAFAQNPNAFLAWKRLSHPHGLTLTIARHEAVPILQAVVNAYALDTLVGGGSVALTEARMDVQVNGLQYFRVELPKGAKIESAEVDGKSVSPRVENDVLLLPCPAGKSRDDRFGVRLVYREDAADASGRSFAVSLTAPKVPDALVQATGWTLWVPADSMHLWGSGNMRPAEWGSVLGAILDDVGRIFRPSVQELQPTARSGALPPKVSLSIEGRRGRGFQRTGEEASLSARFVPTIAVGVIAAVAAVLVVAAAWTLMKRGRSLTLPALGTIAAALILFPTAAPGVRAALALVVITSAAMIFLTKLVVWIRTFRAERAERERARAAAFAAAVAASPAPAPVAAAVQKPKPAVGADGADGADRKDGGAKS